MSFAHKPTPKHAIPRKLALGHFKKIRVGFYGMDRKSVSARTFIRDINEPDVKGTNPKIQIDVLQFDQPTPNFFEFTLLDDTKLSYQGDEFNLKNFLVQHEVQKFDLRARGFNSAMDEDLIKNVDNED